jgi:hypothetical protein
LYKTTRKDTYTALAYAVEGYMPPYIWDRLGPISDPIYSRIQDRDNAFKTSEIQLFRNIVEALRAPIILCEVPLEVAEENQEKAHQMEGVSSNYPYIHGLYQGIRDALLDWHTSVHVYDYRDGTAYPQLLANMKTYIEKRRDREWH